MRKLLFLFFAILGTTTLFAEIDFKTENTNITLKEDRYTYNYDRLRFRLDWEQESYFATMIADGVNYLGQNYIDSNLFGYKQLLRSDTPFKTQTTLEHYNKGAAYAKLYRAYAGYEDEKNRVVVGLQNISMGVGRIWQPTNIYNPKNIYAIEPDETFGVMGALYTRYLDQTSHISGIVSVDRDNKLQYALRYKTFLDVADLAHDLISSDTTKMVGYEIDGSLQGSGIGVRSEGAYFDDNLSNFFQGIVGIDYGFEDGLTVVVETLYSSKIFSAQEVANNYDAKIAQNMVGSHFYGALSLSYPFTIYLDGSFVYIEGFDGERSRFISPQLTYTLNDYNSITISAMLYDTDKASTYSGDLNRYYLKWSLSF